jgi:cell division protein FtsB
MKKALIAILGSTIVPLTLDFIYQPARSKPEDYMILTGEFTNCGTGINTEQCQTQKIYNVNQVTGKSTLIKEFDNPYGWGDAFYDEYSNKVVIEPDNNWDYGNGEDAFAPKFAVFDRTTGSITYMETPDILKNSTDDLDRNFFPFVPGGKPPVTIKEDGSIHIGENSLITNEVDGKQQLYATDANGDAIPIDITNGSDLLINGKSVQSQIETNADNISILDGKVNENASKIDNLDKRVNNVEENIDNLGSGIAGATALSSALSALPTISVDSPFSCGVGTGGYSSRYAMSVGCAFKANERLSFNAGGSYLFGGASNYGGGELSNVAGRAGFVLKLGEIKNSNSSQKKMSKQVDMLKKENEMLQARLENLERMVIEQKSN